MLEMKPEIWKRMFARLEDRYGMTMAELDVPTEAARVAAPILVVHDADDVVVPFEDGASIAAAARRGSIVTAHGLGHYRILRAQDVVDAVTLFVAGPRSDRAANDFAATDRRKERGMPKLIDKPTRIQAAGNKPKLIDEYVGGVNSGDVRLSIAHMRSPGGWVEPGQRPDFDEYTLVLRGQLHIEHEHGAFDVMAGQAVLASKGEWVRYSTPAADGAEYIAVCLPAFTPTAVHRDG